MPFLIYVVNCFGFKAKRIISKAKMQCRANVREWLVAAITYENILSLQKQAVNYCSTFNEDLLLY